MKFSILMIALSFALLGCIEMPDYDQQSKDEGSDISNEYGIVLNDGAKWTVDPEMMEHIRRMEDKVIEFEGENYSALSESLMEDINLLTSNCTMTGQAHDELHKWLLPSIDLVDELGSSEEQKELYTEIQQSYSVFNKYFE